MPRSTPFFSSDWKVIFYAGTLERKAFSVTDRMKSSDSISPGSFRQKTFLLGSLSMNSPRRWLLVGPTAIAGSSARTVLGFGAGRR
jgi:hypothetical protein